MTNDQLKKAVTEGLHRLHDSGVSSKTLTMTVTAALFDFICSEAGAFAPQAVAEVTSQLQELLAEAELA
jgi:hypothetical protein